MFKTSGTFRMDKPTSVGTILHDENEKERR